MNALLQHFMPIFDELCLQKNLKWEKYIGGLVIPCHQSTLNVSIFKYSVHKEISFPGFGLRLYFVAMLR